MSVEWRGLFTNEEVNRLHADAFDHRVYNDTEWPWQNLVERHSLGWVTARSGADLIGFVNVVWDGLVHAWIQDVIVSSVSRHSGVGTRLVEAATDAARAAGCEWLHVDFDDELAPFYVDACGFAPAAAGLISLQEDTSAT